MAHIPDILTIDSTNLNLMLTKTHTAASPHTITDDVHKDTCKEATHHRLVVIHYHAGAKLTQIDKDHCQDIQVTHIYTLLLVPITH